MYDRSQCLCNTAADNTTQVFTHHAPILSHVARHHAAGIHAGLLVSRNHTQRQAQSRAYAIVMGALPTHTMIAPHLFSMQYVNVPCTTKNRSTHTDRIKLCNKLGESEC